MSRSSWSRVSRAFVVTGAIAGAVFASGDAHAWNRYGLIAPHVRGSSASTETRPFAGGGGADTQCGVITYCGGPVLSNVEVVPVYWTSGVSSTVTSQVPSYLKAITDSPFLDMLSEYSTKGKTGFACGMPADGGGTAWFGPATPHSTNQTITRGTATAGVTITPTVTTGTNITDDNGAIGAELVSQIGAGKLQAPTYDAQGYPNTIYFVFFPSNYSITLQGGQSCSQFGGYHYSTTYTGTACTGQYIPYAVIPDCGGGDDSTVISHELAEAVTDTDVGTTGPDPNAGDGAWYLGPDNPLGNSAPMTCGEVGDVCQGQGDSTPIPSTSITGQLIWSQSQQGGSCQISNSGLSAQTAPSGAPITKCTIGPPPADAGPGPGTDSGPGPITDSGPGPVHDSGSGPMTGMDATVPPTTGGNDSGTVVPPTPGTDSGQGGPSASNEGGTGGGNFDNGGSGSSSGCGCKISETRTSSNGAGAIAAFFALGLLARLRNRRRAAR